MKKKILTTRKTKDGYNFYYKGKNITTLWMDFFNALPSEQKKNCEELFLRKFNNL